VLSRKKEGGRKIIVKKVNKIPAFEQKCHETEQKKYFLVLGQHVPL